LGRGYALPTAAKPPLPSTTLDTARDLRHRSTDAEAELWFHLRAGRLLGLKFRRQHPLPPYVVDFYCDSLKLVIELDGSQHGEDVDAARTATLQRQGLTVIRFWNHDVMFRTALVLAEIANVVEGRTLSPTPLPGGEGLFTA